MGILSGILERQCQTITKILVQQGWQVMAIDQQEDWCCLQVERQSAN